MSPKPIHDPCDHGDLIKAGKFVLGQVILLAEHQPNPPSGVFEQWSNDIWQQAWKNHGNVPDELSGPLSSISIKTLAPISFSPPNADGLSQSLVAVVFHPLEDPKFNSEADFHSEDVNRRADKGSGSKPGYGIADNAIIAAVGLLNAIAGTKINEITLRAAGPNWLCTAAPHAFGDGGSGGQPMPVDPALKTSPLQFGKLITHVSSLISDMCSSTKGEVNVVIFDTAPEKAALKNAYKKFTTHDVLNRLSTSGKFEVCYAKPLGIDLPTDPEGHQTIAHYSHHDCYEMSDHGLFISGIVNTIAPEANIYLVEVLNHAGAGTLAGLTQGIKALLDGKVLKRNDIPLVVNCSICFDIGHLGSDPKAVQEIQSLNLAFDTLSATCSTPGVQIIAAAGNDGSPHSHPPSSYPASLSTVLAVAAIENDGKFAWYSNQGNILAFGGKMYAINTNGNDIRQTDDQGGGVLGTYIGKFLDGALSTTGWAWWSGTSFSSAVVSGAFAYAVGNGCDVDTFGATLKGLKDENNILGLTDLQGP